CLLDGFPGLIAACHVLHRLLAPRHPPLTLSSLDINRIPRHRARYAVLKVPEGVIESPEGPGLGETPSRLNSVPTGFLPSRSNSSELPHPTEPEGLFVPLLLRAWKHGE